VNKPPKTWVLHRAAQVVTLAGTAAPRSGPAMSELGLLRNASVIGQGDRITWVGPSDTMDRVLAGLGVQEPNIMDLHHDLVVMPAFCDAHTHIAWVGDRRDELDERLRGASYEAILSRGGGILSTVASTRQASVEQLVDATSARVYRMLNYGTTTLEIKSGYGLDLETELRQLRAAKFVAKEYKFRIKTTCLAAHAVPEQARGNAHARARFVEQVCQEILPAVARERLADYADVFCDRGAFTSEESERVLTTAKSLGMALRVHANELGPTGGATLAARLGAVTADHLVYIDDDDRRALANAGTIAVLLPGTSLVLGSPFADGRALVDAGVPVAVASDCNPGSCPMENLGLAVALACYGNRLTPAEAICAVTHNAACSLGLGRKLGRIEPGLCADMLVLQTDDVRDLVYLPGSLLVDRVMQAGTVRATNRLE